MKKIIVKLIKFIFTTLLIVVVGVEVFGVWKSSGVWPDIYQFELLLFPCQFPITYRIGTVDSRFGLSPDQFAVEVKKAVDIWNQAHNKQLFVKAPDGKIMISLVYDNRQSLDTQIQKIHQEIDSKKNSLDAQSFEYDQLVANYKSKLTDYQSQVAKWNTQGGAPTDVYNQLMQEKQDLENESIQINNLAQKFNKNVQSYNLNVGTLQQTVTQFSEALAQKPEEGVYDTQARTIEIYFNVNENELVHTIAHEFGHALGFDHSQNPDSIMYEYSTQSVKLPQDEKSTLDNYCHSVPLFKLMQTNALRIYQQLRTIITAKML